MKHRYDTYDFEVFADWLLNKELIDIDDAIKLIEDLKNGKHFDGITFYQDSDLNYNLIKTIANVSDEEFILNSILKYSSGSSFVNIEFVSLLGRVVKKLYVSADDTRLAFELKTGSFLIWELYSECCSQTWFADILGIKDLINSKIIDVTSWFPDSVEDGRSLQEVERFYGIKIHHEKGITDIIFRNSSNGYYGGYLNNAPVLTKKLPDDFKVIKSDDWSS